MVAAVPHRRDRPDRLLRDAATLWFGARRTRGGAEIGATRRARPPAGRDPARCRRDRTCRAAPAWRTARVLGRARLSGGAGPDRGRTAGTEPAQIGRASCRERV